MNHYSTLAILTYQLKKAEDPNKQKEIEQQIKKLVDHVSEDNNATNLYNLYHYNASFASKMSSMIEDSARELYTKGLLEKDSELMQDYIGRSFSMLADSVIWDEISSDFYAILEENEIDDEELE